MVDESYTGFVVHNERTYPNLLRLFAELAVPRADPQIGMSIGCAGCGLNEMTGALSLGSLFAPAPARPGARPTLRMLTEVRRFHAHADRLLAHSPETPQASRRPHPGHLPGAGATRTTSSGT